MLYFLAILLFLSVITEDTARRVLSWFDSQATQSARDVLRLTDSSQETGAPNENIVQNRLNIALLNVF